MSDEDEMKRVINILTHQTEGFTISELIKRTKIKRSTLYVVLKELIDFGRIDKTEGYPKRYWLITKENNEL